ncbi:MAG: signal peptidase II [Acidimicrobiia bacterium]
MRSTLTPRRATLLIAAGVVALDQITKVWASSALADGPVVLVRGVLALQLNTNTGAAFGFFRGGGSLIAIAAIVAVVLILRISADSVGVLEVTGLGLILGGAIGNLADRVTRGDGLLDGAVVDWIQLPNFPTFNVADAAITIGAVLLILGALRKS